MKRLEISASEIIVQSVISEQVAPYRIYKSKIDDIDHKKKIFIADLKIVVDIANKVRIEYAPTTSEYKINDIYLAKVIKANQKKNSMIYHLDVYR